MTTDRQPLSYYLGLEYPYTVMPDEGSYFIKFHDLPGCMTQVEDPAEIAAMAEEIRTLWIEGEYEDGHDIPEPTYVSSYSGKFVVRLPRHLHRDLAESAEREGVSLNTYVTSLLAERNMTAQMDSRLARIERSLGEQHQDSGDTAARPLAKTG
jgi:predicted RNase H-like HicB family nuclease